MKGTLPVATPTLSVRRRRDRDTLTLLLTGDIDMASAPRLAAALDEAAGAAEAAETAGATETAGGPVFRCLVVDLNGVGFMDSAGLHVLVDLAGRVHTAGAEIAVVSAPGTPRRRVIELTGLSGRLGLTDTHPDQPAQPSA